MLEGSRAVYRIAAAIWLGALTFLAFMLSPVAFGLVGPVEIGDLVQAAVGWVYPAATGAAIAAATALGARAFQGDRQQLRAKGVLLAAAFALTAASFLLGLRMEALADARPAFDQAHRQTQGLLGIALLLVLVLVGIG